MFIHIGFVKKNIIRYGYVSLEAKEIFTNAKTQHVKRKMFQVSGSFR